ncbi:hypothetical protein UA08_03140 [Talaromyces atroroseus]|uniref:Carbohydrate kinase PfkB domain-containing protein n=1 Tax=Talaromyces atroroseus TaxID=1441469 RepID=A0A225B0E2_TALAT|nr:hypothetical protein UA08_03140 [Talaromyces atroroseus]OKL61429.1 hypothetical protein UA08_03140 [Talaromyces atroroseus]
MIAPKTISIIGGLDLDLIIIANRLPNGGESLLANEYLEALGGKGANSAIATYRACHRKPMDMHDPPQVGQVDEVDNAIHVEGKIAETREQASHIATSNSLDDDVEINVRIVGAVGDEKYGERLYVELKESGVDASGIITVPNTQSSICFVIVDNYTRENRCLFTLGATATWKKIISSKWKILHMVYDRTSALLKWRYIRKWSSR